jgi:alkaline phosphatase
MKETVAELRYVADWAQHHLDKAKIINDASDYIEAQQVALDRAQKRIDDLIAQMYADRKQYLNARDALVKCLSLLHFMNDNGYMLTNKEQGRMDAAIAEAEMVLG